MSDPRPLEPRPSPMPSAPVAELHGEAAGPGPGLVEVRSRIARGVLAVALRGGVVNSLALVTNIAVARVLSPAELGALAFGTAVMLVGGFLGDAGLGAGLIRRREAPSSQEFGALLGVQLSVTAAFVGLLAILLAVQTQLGLVTLVMATSLPLVSLRMPASITLERDLRYGVLLRVEVVETLAFTAWTIGGLLAGWGVWSVATAIVVRAVVGTSVILGWTRQLPPRPRLSRRLLRPLLSFGLQFQAVSVVNVVRDYGMNLGVAALGGLALLGQWSLIVRVMQLPMLVIHSFWRVSFPGMARLLEAGEEPRRLLERATSAASLGLGAVLTGLGACAPLLVPAVFGQRWQPAADAIPFVVVAFLVTGPVSMAVTGYLYAAGEAALILRTTALHTAVWFGISMPFLRAHGVSALAVGWIAGAAIETIGLTRRATRLTGAGLWRRLLWTPAIGTAVVAGFVLTCGHLSATVPVALLVGVLGAAVFALVLMLVQPVIGRETATVARQGLAVLRR